VDKIVQYCSACGAGVEKRIPPGDDHLRYVCNDCGTIHYQNPKLVVGCIPEYQNRILLCRRDIEPRRGKWTLPAGFLENGETVREGAWRETYEEARVRVEIIAPFRLFDLAFVNQLYLMFRASIAVPEFSPTPESSEVRLVLEKDIPWEEIAFPVIAKTLQHYFRDRSKGDFQFQSLELSESTSSIK
jgi:ADP-ribose pyrophosphatase YjhB (NUDIX family)